jgi:hypothetical protein
MWRPLSIALLVVGLAGLAASMLRAEGSAMIDLVVPRTAVRGDTVRVQVTVGPLPRGARLVLSSANGEILGAVTPFGPAGNRATTATVAITRSAVIDDHLRLRVQVVEPGASPRAPNSGETAALKIVVLPESE